jgi:hypothetical protein
VRLQEEILGLYYKPGTTSENINNNLLYFKQDVMAPPRLAGGVLLVHETLNAKAQPRQAWVYNPGQRRVRRAPNVAYDNPGTASDGLRTNDMTDMFNGAMDRFSWTLVGKKEMYIPYNCYKADSSSTKVSDLVKPGHLNSDLIRDELHRVWVVEAKLKPGQRHINSRRTMYLDEDSWQIVGIDHYDGQGTLWRYSEAPNINYYEVPTVWATIETHHDLQSGRYISGLLDNEEKFTIDFGFQTNAESFSPQSLPAKPGCAPDAASATCSSWTCRRITRFSSSPTRPSTSPRSSRTRPTSVRTRSTWRSRLASSSPRWRYSPLCI